MIRPAAVRSRSRRSGRGRDAVILGSRLAERARYGRVARIGEHRVAGPHTLLVHSLETGERHVDLAADLHHERVILAAQSERDRRDRPQVRRHAFADDSVAPCRPFDQHAFAVRQRRRCAVDFQLTVIAALASVFTGEAHDPLLPRRQLFFVERVRQREHRDEMRVLHERTGRLRANALRRRVGGSQRRVFFLERQERAIELVVRRVGNRRPIEDVVVVRGLIDLAAKLRGAGS